MQYDTHTNFSIKYIATELENDFEPDVMQMMSVDGCVTKTPVIATIAKLWNEGQWVDITNKRWYAHQNNVAAVFNKLGNIRIFEVLRLLIHTELCSINIYMNISEKLSRYAMFAYVAMYELDITQPMRAQLEEILCDSDIQWAVEEYKKANEFFDGCSWE